jgi:hypothetical protein
MDRPSIINCYQTKKLPFQPFFLCLILLVLSSISCSLGAPGSAASTEAVNEENLGIPSLTQILPTAPVLLQETESQEPILTQSIRETEPPTQLTAQASTMYSQVQNLYNEGVISTLDGTYYALPDFENSWAQMNSYDYELTDYTVTDFVLSTDTEWESASTSANWANSGCAFVFRLNARGDHYLGYLGLDGWFYLYQNLSKTLKRLGKWYYDQVDIPKGQAKITLVVEGDQMTFLVNDQEVEQVTDDTFQTGLLGYALLSGTNKDFGTRCRITNVELWEIR